MKCFVLFLSAFILGLVPVNFASAKNASTTTATAFACTDCWDYATGLENKNYPGGRYSYWNKVFQNCNENLNPCAGQLDEVVVTPKRDNTEE